MPSSAHDVAALIIDEQRAAGRSIDKLQLQKLLAIVQGANLVFWGERAFRDPLLAYRNGPVVPAVEVTYRTVIDGRESITSPLGGQPSRLPPEVVETVRTVLHHFGTWTGPELERHVKGPDSPWQAVRNDLPSSASSKAEIPAELMRDWFVRRGIDPNPPTADVWQATDDDRRASRSRRQRNNPYSVLEPFEMTPALESIARSAVDRARATEDQ